MSDLALFDEVPPQPCTHVWTDAHPAVPHEQHRCVFVANTVGHSRHECRCGINAHEART